MTHIEETGEFTQDDHNNLLKRNAMTVEQMNRVIAEYDATKFDVLPTAIGHRTCYNVGGNWRLLGQMKYHENWNEILRVWQKIRGEFRCLPLSKYADHAFYPKMKDLMLSIEVAIAHDTDITTAHRLIVEAIQLIKK